MKTTSSRFDSPPRNGRPAAGTRRARGRLPLAAALLLLVGAAAAQEGAGTASTAPATQALDAAQVEGLQWMREEEKLARDVYGALAAQWPMRIFEHIGAAEERHMAAVAGVMGRYNVADPIGDLGAGVFSAPKLQALYDDLVQQGSTSRADAMRIAALVEEIDLLDLRAQLAQTTAPDVRVVYENLSRGTRNHLRAFSRQYERLAGEPYVPQRLAPEAYAEVVSAGTERGGCAQGGCGLQAGQQACAGCGCAGSAGGGKGRGAGRGRGRGAATPGSSI